MRRQAYANEETPAHRQPPSFSPQWESRALSMRRHAYANEETPAPDHPPSFSPPRESTALSQISPGAGVPEFLARPPPIGVGMKIGYSHDNEMALTRWS